MKRRERFYHERIKHKKYLQNINKLIGFMRDRNVRAGVLEQKGGNTLVLFEEDVTITHHIGGGVPCGETIPFQMPAHNFKFDLKITPK